MEEVKTNIRQADNKAKAEGHLAEKKLEVSEINGNKVIKGNITIQTSADNFITFSVYVPEKTKNGTDNKAYAGISTVMNEYKSIADVGKDDADKVRVSNGQINPYTRADEAGNIIEGLNYRTNFINRVRETDTFDPHAEFEVEMYVSAFIPEIKNDVETGRVIVKGYVPTYNGIESLTLVAPKDGEVDWAELISQNYTIGKTGRFFGTMENHRIETVTKVPLLGGAVKEEKSYHYENELLITGASEPYGEDDDNAYSADVIKAALTEKEIENKRKIEDARGRSGNSGGFASTRATSSTAAAHRSAPVPQF